MKQLEVIYPFDIEVLAETKRILRLLIHNELVAIEQRNHRDVTRVFEAASDEVIDICKDL